MFGSMQMAVSRVIKLQHHRIAQVLEVGGTRDSLAYTVWRCGAGQSQPRDLAFPLAPDKCTLVHGAQETGHAPRLPAWPLSWFRAPSHLLI